MNVELQNSLGTWGLVDLDSLTWCGQPVVLTEAQRAALQAGGTVQFAPEWYARVRLPRAPRTPLAAPSHRFTCRHCGGHRDTTLPGQCDDCNN